MKVDCLISIVYHSTIKGNSCTYISEKIEHYEKIKKSKEIVLETKMYQLFLLKKKGKLFIDEEQKALKLGKKNKDIVYELNLLETTLKVMKNKMNNLKEKGNDILM